MQHDAHYRAYLDFWCAQFERLVAIRSKPKKDEAEADIREGDLYQ